MDTNNTYNGIIFSKNVVEFVTVGVQYCSLLENMENTNQKEITDKLTKILPLLYLKANLLPEFEVEYEFFSETFVKEEDYNFVLNQIYNTYKKDDSFLEVFADDMKYSDTPISASIAENLTDIYQDVKNFISIYELGVEESMAESLYGCIENFKLYWGQKLVNVLRALHWLKYSVEDDSLAEDDEFDNIEEEW